MSEFQEAGQHWDALNQELGPYYRKIKVQRQESYTLRSRFTDYELTKIVFKMLCMHSFSKKSKTQRYHSLFWEEWELAYKENWYSSLGIIQHRPPRVLICFYEYTVIMYTPKKTEKGTFERHLICKWETSEIHSARADLFNVSPNSR